jgi:hypothetical protein
VIIDMITMHMMVMTIMDVVHVVVMFHGFMAAFCVVFVAVVFVSRMCIVRYVSTGFCRARCRRAVLIEMVAMLGMIMAVVYEVFVIAVLDRFVSTIFRMIVIMCRRFDVGRECGRVYE